MTRVAQRTVGLGAVALVVVATALDLPIHHPGHAETRLVLAVLGYSALAVVLVVHHVRPFLTRRLVLGAVLVLLTVAVALPPRSSRDVWSYAMYGRAVSVHHESPYTVDPDDFRGDPMLSRVSPRWREQPSVYGPVFVGVAAGITAVTGASPLATRLGFQLLAALLALTVLLMIGRVTGDPAAMAWFGLNPMIAFFVVNEGHNDLMVGAAILGAVLLAERRPGRAGALVGLAGLVKVAGLLALPALAVSMARRLGMRAGAAVLAAGAGVAVGGYLVVGWGGLMPLRAASQWHTPASLASAILAVDPRVHAVVFTELLVGLAVMVHLRRGMTDSVWLVGVVVTTYLLAAPYVLPWYFAWVLPVAALAWRSRLAILLAVQTAVFAVISVDSRTVTPEGLHDALSTATHWLLPVLEVAALAVLVATRRPRRRAVA